MRSSASSVTTPSSIAVPTGPIPRRCSTSARCSAPKRAPDPDSPTMSTRHPVIAVTGSSGAGTTTVMKAFAHIFRREGLKAEVIEGDSFHRYSRIEMRERVAAADSGRGPAISHFGPEANLLAERADTREEYGATGGGKLRRYVHDAGEAKETGCEPGTFTPWSSMQPGSDLL